MESMREQLISLGLSPTEVEIYLIGIGYPSLGVAELQKLTNIKRPTIYHALHELTDKGLVAKSGSETRLQFSFAPLEQIQRLIEGRIAELEQKARIIAELAPMLASETGNYQQTVVSHYEGIEGVKTVVDIALYCRKPHWDILAPKKNFFSDFDPKYADYFMTTRRRKGIKARSLWEQKLGSGILKPDEINQRQPRFLPEVMHGNFQSVLILFDDKVAIISSAQKLSAILITSPESHTLFTSIFEGLWSVSKPYKP
jgi:predicted transcriptional regulator